MPIKGFASDIMSFLRKLRHQFVLKGDAKKHALFMLAEIILITVGISVALQFDEWKEEKEVKKSEIVLLDQLYVEFNEIRNRTLVSIGEIKSRRPDIALLYQSCGKSNNNFSELRLAQLLSTAYLHQKINFNNGILEEALATGKVSLIKNDELRVALSSWENRVKDMYEVNQNLNNFMVDYINYSFKYVPYRILDDGFYPELELGASKLGKNPNLIFQDLIFENQIGLIYFQNETLERKYNNRLLTPCENILELIQQELEEKR